MPKKLYNEGRVVGLDSYSLYVKQALATDGVTEVATEREWLASTIANGSSLLLQIPGGLTAGVYDIKLPSGSRLVSANTIIGSFAYGVESDSWENATTTQTISQKFKWAKRVTCYGNISKPPISKQTSAKGMSNNNNTTATTNECTSEQMQYIKIIDGIVYQFGKWKLSSVENNDKIKTVPDDIQYDQTYVRLAFRDDIASNKPFCILLTGFTDLAVVYGVTGLEGDPTNISNNINDWKNGGFLGPSKFPWASKIWFATPGNLTYELKMGLTGGGQPNVFITNDKDSVETKIEVMNNITTDKSAEYLSLVPVDKDNQPITDADKKKHAAGYKVEIDGAKLIDDSVSPGYGISIVNSSNEKNSQNTPKKVIKTNISSDNYSGIDVSQPTTADANKSGSVTQKISTVLESGKGTGITISNGTGKAKKIATNLRAGTGIQIGTVTDQDSDDTSKTIATNIVINNGLSLNNLSHKDKTGSQVISRNVIYGTGIVVSNCTDKGISTTPITNNGTERPTINGESVDTSTLKITDTVRYASDPNYPTLYTRFRWNGSKWINVGQTTSATGSLPEIIRTNIKSSGSVSITPASSAQDNSAQTINTDLKPGKGITVNNATGEINTKLSAGGDGLSIDNDAGTITNTWALSKNLATNVKEGTSFTSPRGELVGDSRPTILKITTGTKSVHALLLSDGVVDDSQLDANRRTISVNPNDVISLNQSNSKNNISWSALLDALHNDRGIDILGDRLKSAKETLVKESNTGYLEFGSASKPLRLYISSDVPSDTDVPVGSIGIGWGFSG